MMELLSNNYTMAMALVVLVLAYKNLPWVWHVSDSPVLLGFVYINH